MPPGVFVRSHITREIDVLLERLRSDATTAAMLAKAAADSVQDVIEGVSKIDYYILSEHLRRSEENILQARVRLGQIRGLRQAESIVRRAREDTVSVPHSR